MLGSNVIHRFWVESRVCKNGHLQTHTTFWSDDAPGRYLHAWHSAWASLLPLYPVDTVPTQLQPLW